jgi:hypothetical protein
LTPLERTFSARQRLALQVLTPLLTGAGGPAPDMGRVTITAKSIIEHSSYSAITDTIVGADMPEIVGPTTLDHYTGGTGFRGITGSRELWLTPVLRRLHEGELGPFAIEHGLDGYVDANGVATSLMREAATDLCYASLTAAPPDDHLWETFGERGSGYRLRFEITQGAAGRLRAIRYQSGKILLKRVNDDLVAHGLPRFVLKGVSRLGAYHLPLVLSSEKETRLLAKRFAVGDDPVVATPSGEHWPVPIGTSNDTADVTLAQIGVRGRDPAIASAKLPRWCAHVPVVAD